MLAVANGHQGTVELLIVYGNRLLDATDNRKRTALFRGAAFGQEACVHVLLEQEVSPTQRDIYGQTAFHIAAKSGQVAVLRSLLGNIHILRKYFHSTKPNLITYFFTKKMGVFSSKRKNVFFNITF